MTTIRPGGSGTQGSAVSMLRSTVAPRAVLVFQSGVAPPADWPRPDGGIESNLGHALGWTCEVRRSDVILLNPLGEGVVRAPLPALSASWLDNVAHDGSCAVYVVAPGEDDSVDADPSLAVTRAAAAGTLWAATVRTAIAADYGTTAPVGRNQPCPCGSGKKYKHCHG